MPDKLDKLLSDFSDRKQQERKQEEERKEQERKRREAYHAAQIPPLQNIVFPVLSEFSAELKRRGHRSRCGGPEENNKPFANLTLKVLAEDCDSSVEESELVFEGRNSSKDISVYQHIIGKNTTCYYDGVALIHSANLTDEWVRSKVIKFVELVLKAQ